MSRLPGSGSWPAVALGAAVGLALLAFVALASSGQDERALQAGLALAANPSPQARARAEAALFQAAQRGPQRRRAQAANVLAALALDRRGDDGATRAIDLYRTAIRLDPSDRASKFDLELLLALRRRQGRHGATHKGGHSPPKNQGASKRGAAFAKPGEGY